MGVFYEMKFLVKTDFSRHKLRLEPSKKVGTLGQTWSVLVGIGVKLGRNRSDLVGLGRTCLDSLGLVRISKGKSLSRIQSG